MIGVVENDMPRYLYKELNKRFNNKIGCVHVIKKPYKSNARVLTSHQTSGEVWGFPSKIQKDNFDREKTLIYNWKMKEYEKNINSSINDKPRKPSHTYLWNDENKNNFKDDDTRTSQENYIRTSAMYDRRYTVEG